MKLIAIIVSAFMVFSSCQRNNISADENKKALTERSFDQNFMVNSTFYDLGQMANTIWLNCSVYGDNGFDNFYVNSKNRELVMRKGGVKSFEIGISTSDDVFKTLGYPDEVESNTKWIYRKDDGNIEYIISFFFTDYGILENIVYNVCNL